MFSTTSKIILGILSFFLIVILFAQSESFGGIILLVSGIFVLIASIYFANDVKKLNNSLSSKVFSTILINTTLYSTLLLFYGLGNIGVGDKGLLFIFTLIVYAILLALSIIIGIILVIRNKINVYQGNPNKILISILFFVLIILSYTTVVSGMAKLSKSPSFCSMHIEMKDNSFIFRKGNQNSCVFRIALDTSSLAFCKQIKDSYVDVANSLKNKCILNVARDLSDTSLCYQITNDKQRQGDCVRYIGENTGDLTICETPGVDRDMCYSNIARGKRDNGNPEICKLIKDNQCKYHCFSIIAIDKKDTSICEKYFPSDEKLINEGVNPADYSKSECIKDATNGYF